MEKVAAIILAGGEGKRMNSHKVNKAAILLGNKQMIAHTVDKLKDLGVSPIIVVVGFAKESIINVLKDSVIYAEQRERLGTAHAVICALKKLPQSVKNVLVLNGDDSVFYPKDMIRNLIDLHLGKDVALSFLTITVDDPRGLGRVVRDGNGKVIKIVEDKDLAGDQKTIKEINPGCYVFKTSFLRQYLSRVKKSPVSKEYYLTSLIDIAEKNKESLMAISGGNMMWRGINTPEELEEAKKMFLNIK